MLHAYERTASIGRRVDRRSDCCTLGGAYDGGATSLVGLQDRHRHMSWGGAAAPRVGQNNFFSRNRAIFRAEFSACLTNIDDERTM